MKPRILVTTGAMAILALIMTLGCSRNNSDIMGPKLANLNDTSVTIPHNNPPAIGDVFKIDGVVTYVPVEGGFFGIIANDGTHYDPTNLNAKYQQDGLRVRISATLSKSGNLTHMWGTDIDILGIEVIAKATDHAPTNHTN